MLLILEPNFENQCSRSNTNLEEKWDKETLIQTWDAIGKLHVVKKIYKNFLLQISFKGREREILEIKRDLDKAAKCNL